MSDEAKPAEWNGGKHLDRIENHVKSIDGRLQLLEDDLRNRIIHIERSVKDHEREIDEINNIPWHKAPISWQFLLVFAICLATVGWVIGLSTTLGITRDELRHYTDRAIDIQIKAGVRDALQDNVMENNRRIIESLKEKR